jgi:hypothetical protein
MATETGDDSGAKALSGEKVWVGAKVFEVTEDMMMEFEGSSCNILDSEGNVLHQYGPKDGFVKREIRAGLRCYVLESYIMFKKKLV